MVETVEYNKAKSIMGNNFVGLDELRKIESLTLELNIIEPDIHLPEELLFQRKNDYLLVLGVSRFADGCPVTIRNLKKIYGQDPEISEPCFYNQDWYEKESFIDIPMKDEWYLIRKNVYEESRAVQPDELLKKYSFPSAITCVYTFFMAWYALGIKLWYNDFVWCSDLDHNGDRIYVGKYHDVDGINKNGFSIHRHLSLRPCYACID